MRNTPHTLFISDLHLEQSQLQTTTAFLDFLHNLSPHANALYILGDFFEVWVGDDNHSKFNQLIIHALKKLTNSGLPIYFMHGNRDFLIGRKFAKQTGVTLLEDPTIIQLYGKKILLMHGDSLCTLDEKAQKFRKFRSNKLYRKLFLIIPLKFREIIAQKIRGKSKQHQQKIDNEILDVTPSEIIRVMTEHDVQLLIHGHTHRPNIHDVIIDGKPAKRIVLGSWHHEGSVLAYKENGEFNLDRLAFKN